MSDEVAGALVGAAVPFLLLVLGVVLLIAYWKDLRRLVRNASRIKVGGFELDVAQSTLAASKQRPVSKVVAARLARRAAVIAEDLAGRRVLWVDDEPHGNAAERKFLRAAGLVVTNAVDTGAAMAHLEQDDVDVVITDLRRGDDLQAGEALAKRMRSRGFEQPIVGYIGEVDHSRPLPAHFRALADAPDELISTVFDIIESASAAERDED